MAQHAKDQGDCPRRRCAGGRLGKSQAVVGQCSKNYGKVIVISDQHHERYEAEHGLVYVPNEFWAGVERATCLPSKRGYRSVMADIIESLNGNVVGISPNRGDVSDALS